MLFQLQRMSNTLLVAHDYICVNHESRPTRPSDALVYSERAHRAGKTNEAKRTKRTRP